MADRRAVHKKLDVLPFDVPAALFQGVGQHLLTDPEALHRGRDGALHRLIASDSHLDPLANSAPRSVPGTPSANRHRRCRASGSTQRTSALRPRGRSTVWLEFFTDVLGFDLAEDSASLTNDGRPKRWVVVRPPGAETGILLARGDGERQSAAVGNQVGGRVGFFLRVDDFDAAYKRMASAGVTFVTSPRTEPYGRVAVFLDIAGNRWDLLGPA
jgi:catechol 2,3-dioxygenase-like lactoylglutathione lyase family enzyme